MAQLWSRDSTTRAWVLNRIEGKRAILRPTERPMLGPLIEGECASAAMLECHHTGDRETWALLVPCGNDAEVNGAAVLAGIHILGDGDTLRLDGFGPFFLSTETLACVEQFPHQLDNTFCPRCKLNLATGEPAVRCPKCRTWHHEGEHRRCWTYTPTCALCPQATAFDVGYEWTPAEL